MRWSGLAPAVDAHLARWSAIDGEMRKLDRLGVKENETVRVGVNAFPHTASWSIFAQTWGVPDGDNVIHSPVIVDGQTINGREQFTADEYAASAGLQLMTREHEMLQRAETHYVSGPVVERITSAAWDAGMEEGEPIFEDDIITPYGLAILEHPILIPDLHPETGEVTDFLRVAVRAFGWKPESVARIGMENSSGPGIMLFAYTTRDDWNDSYGSDMFRAWKRGLLAPHEVGLPDDITDEQMRRKLRPPRSSEGLARDALWPMDVMPWRFDTPWQIGRTGNLKAGVMDTTVAVMRRWFLCFQRFCWQRIIVSHRERLTPKASRRIELSRKVPPRDYSVLRLRRELDSPHRETGTGLPLGYRLLVRGHKRRAWVRSLGPARNPDGSFNEGSHRLVWVDPYWKGPEDGPIGALHKSTAVVR